MRIVSILSLLALAKAPGVQDCSLTNTNSLVTNTFANKDSTYQSRNLQISLPRVGAVASSIENRNDRDANNAIDGNETSRWASQRTDNEWIYVDLGAQYKLSRVILKWERAFGLNYDIEISNNTIYWVLKQSVLKSDGGTDIIDLPPNTAARYVRMRGRRRGTIWGYSLWEFLVEEEAIRTTSAPVNTQQPTRHRIFDMVGFELPRVGARASSEKTVYPALKAIDSDVTTRWQSRLKRDNEWIYVDMGAAFLVTRVILHWGFAFAREYIIETSFDARRWTVKRIMTNDSRGMDIVDLPANTRARYVRMRGRRRGTRYGYELWEMLLEGVAHPGRTPAPIISAQNTPNRKPSTIGSVREIPLTTPGDNRSPTLAFPLGRCEGDCDRDRDCRPGLICFHRSGMMETVPGCRGQGLRYKDYCYDPSDTLQRPTPYSRPARKPSPTTSLTDHTLPSTFPTPFPTLSTTVGPTPPGPVLFKLHWQEGYRWQGKPFERRFCMFFNQTHIVVERCETENMTKWEFLFLSTIDNDEEGDQIRMSGSNQCIGLRRSNNRSLTLRPCDPLKPNQRWISGVKGGFHKDKFDIRPLWDPSGCLTQPHHPKAREKVKVYSCDRAHRHTTGYWNKE